EFAAPQRYALWHDRAVFHFLITDQDQQKYRDVLCASMQPGGYVVMATFAVEGPRRCSGLDTMQYDADSLHEVLGPDFQLLETRIEQHRTPSDAEQKFAWFLLQYQPEGLQS
ncbi:MAG: SAM-dependent methyltransferase, partial [Ignavibacteria bacterium]